MKRNELSGINDTEWDFLMKFVSNAEGDIVELGTGCGGTAYGICSQMPKEYNFYTIDIYSDTLIIQNPRESPHYNPLLVREKLNTVKQNAFVLIGDSTQLGLSWIKDVWLVIIDANHASFNALIDFLAWGNKSKYILFHDYNYVTGVNEAVDFIIDCKLYGVKYLDRIDTYVLVETNKEIGNEVRGLQLCSMGQPVSVALQRNDSVGCPNSR